MKFLRIHQKQSTKFLAQLLALGVSTSGFANSNLPSPLVKNQVAMVDKFNGKLQLFKPDGGAGVNWN